MVVQSLKVVANDGLRSQSGGQWQPKVSKWWLMVTQSLKGVANGGLRSQSGD